MPGDGSAARTGRRVRRGAARGAGLGEPAPQPRPDAVGLAHLGAGSLALVRSIGASAIWCTPTRRAPG